MRGGTTIRLIPQEGTRGRGEVSERRLRPEQRDRDQHRREQIAGHQLRLSLSVRSGARGPKENRSHAQCGNALEDNQPGERTKKGHEGMRPRMAFLSAGFTGDDQSPMSPGPVVYVHLYPLRHRFRHSD